MTERARLASEADLDAVEAIAARVAGDMADARGGALFLVRESVKGTVRERFGRAVASDDQLAIVGCFDDVAFGFVLATIEVLPDGTRLGVIEALTVLPEARGVGIGEAMMNLVLSELQSAGCAGVDSLALPGDRETKNFFESFGLKARLLTVHQRFGEQDPGADADGTVPPA